MAVTMMDMRKIHAEALQSGLDILHCLRLRYRPSNRTVYAIVEGHQDQLFYHDLIERKLPSGWNVEFFSSGGKEKVLRAFQRMDWSRYPPKRICFFVDRDLSDFLGGEPISGSNLYITDKYSIENEVATFSVLSRVQRQYLDITQIDVSELEMLREVFNSNLTTFRETMAPIMAQILLWRRAGTKANLENIRLQDLFTFADGVLRIRPEFDTPTSRAQKVASDIGQIVSNPDDLRKVEVEFRSKKGPEKYIRGKFVRWFFVQCNLEIHRCISCFCAYYSSTAPRPRVQFHQRNAMNLLGVLARCPSSLSEFIRGNFVEYIQGVESAARRKLTSGRGFAPAF